MVDFIWFHSAVVYEGGRFVYRMRMWFMRVSVFALLWLTSVILCAQEYNFRNFGVTEGLSNLAVRLIYQDRVGFIWVSTENGIFRYDGERFQSFGLEQGIPSTSVTCPPFLVQG